MLEVILGQWVWEWAREWAWWAATSKWVWWRRHKWRLRLTPTVNGVTVPEVGLATDCSKNKEKRGTGTLTLSIFRSPSESTQSSKFDPVRRPGLKSTRQPTNSEASYPVPHQWKVHICRPYSLTIILFGIRATSKKCHIFILWQNCHTFICDNTCDCEFRILESQRKCYPTMCEKIIESVHVVKFTCNRFQVTNENLLLWQFFENCHFWLQFYCNECVTFQWLSDLKNRDLTVPKLENFFNTVCFINSVLQIHNFV